MFDNKAYQRQYRLNHKDDYKKAYQRYYASHKEQILEHQKQYNAEHRNEINIAKRKYYYANKAKICARQKAKRLQNIERYMQYHLNSERRLKVEVLTYYGNGKFACVICGESRFPCLSIDHIDGKGAQHRNILGFGKVGGGKFYRWLKLNAYPQGYQTLCMNCQWVKKYEKKEFSMPNRPDKVLL